METGKILVLSLVCLCTHGLPSQQSFPDIELPVTRNTIFADERFPGQVFEKVDAFNNIELEARSDNASLYRLSGETRPLHYDIMWTIDLMSETPTHSGVVKIQLYATRQPQTEIILHADQLSLSNIRLTRNNEPINIVVEQDVQHQLLKIRLTDSMLTWAATPQIYVLEIHFAGNLRDDMYGIYKNWYTDSRFSSGPRWMASTQFQATAARLAFPCYDEPSFKATFTVTIRRQAQFGSWFCTRRNGEPKPVIDPPGWYDDEYHTTPIMSTYLLALIVADYTRLGTEDGSYEVIARYDAIMGGQGVYANETGHKLLIAMNQLTQYDFTKHDENLKMTQAAIPDFGAGAMENWGLLTYREAYLMYSPGETNSHFKRIIAYILSHEIAHQWFGNLVTCDWWDNMWLNEGFASYYEYFLTHEVEDYMDFPTRYIPEHVHNALLADAANNPHALTNQASVNSNSAISSMFSTISYQKGGAIIRMTEHLLGTAAFRDGLTGYLEERAFKTALPIHLFESLEEAAIRAGVLNYGPDFSFIDYFKSWTEQPGHPVLNVHVNHATGIMTIYQRRFNINTGYSATGNNYIVPITFATANNPVFTNTKPTHIISRAITFINRGFVGDAWVIFNNQQSGFYRVNYDAYTWDLIAIALKESRTLIHELNRAQIVNDVFQFARSNLMSYSRAFNILSFLEDETDYAPWVAALNGFNWLRNRLNTESTRAEFNRLNDLIKSWSVNVMYTLNYTQVNGEPFLRTLLRYQLAPLMCNLEVDYCLSAAKLQFDNYLTYSQPVFVENRNWVYCNGLRQSEPEVAANAFARLLDRFRTSNVYTEKLVILQNLGCTRDRESLRQFMNLIITPNHEIRPQDYNTAFSSAVNGNEENTDIAYEFIRDNLDRVASAFSNSVATPLSFVIARFRSQSQITDFMTWAEENRNDLGPAYNSTMNNARSALESISWANSVQGDINGYFDNPPPLPTLSTEGPVTVPNINTSPQPVINQPVTPYLPTTPRSAATSNAVTIVTIVTCLLFNNVLYKIIKF